MNEQINKIDRKYLYCGIGLLLSLGAPLGWYLLVHTVVQNPSTSDIYVYLSVSTSIVFASFGFGVGKLFDQVKELSERDGLTGLYNVSSFQIISTSLLEFCKRYKKPVSCMMIDIDNFKSINDRFGHNFGSEVIAKIASVLTDCARKSDVVCRYGGDEFSILLPEASMENATEVATRIQKKMKETSFFHSKEGLTVTLSFGISSTDKEGASLKRMLGLADDALYASKEAGRNTYRAKMVQ